MWAKLATGLVTPLLALVLVVGLLRATDRTALPGPALPAVASAHVTTSTGGSASGNTRHCLGKLPKHFAGLAVKGRIVDQTGGFAHVTGNVPQIVEFYNRLKKGFNAGEAQAVMRLGKIPFIQLNPKGTPPAEIAAGKDDKLLRSYANAVRKFACAIILSFGHEMNGWWYHWGKPWTSPEEYIAAWRHIHKIFTSVGAGNVTWSWDPSHQYHQVGIGKVATPASEWYPGNQYVDIVGLDGYLGYDKDRKPQNFREIFGFQLNDIRRIAPHKLVYLAETGVAPGRAASSQIKGLFAGLTSYHLAGLVWFDAVGQPDATGKLKDYRLQYQPTMATVYTSQLGAFLR